MGFFRRKPDETLNEQRLREAGLDPDGDTPHPEERHDSVTASPNEPEPFVAMGPPDPFDASTGTYSAQPAFGRWPAYLSDAMARPAVWDLVVDHIKKKRVVAPKEADRVRVTGISGR